MYQQTSESVQSSNIISKSCEVASVQMQFNGVTFKTRLQLDQRLQNSMHSPVRRVPTEIMGEIFQLTLPTVLDSDDRKDMTNIRLVSKRWNEACLLVHRLHNGLSLTDLDQTVPYDKIENWFKRAGNVPKSLELAIPYHNDCDQENSICHSFSAAVATLLAKGTVLEKFTLECAALPCFQWTVSSLSETIDNAQTPRPIPWERLRSFGLRFAKVATSDDSPDPLTNILSNLPPNIVSLELYLRDTFEARDPAPESLCYFPPAIFQQLTSLTLLCNWGGPVWLARALEHCVNVESLTLDFEDSPWSYEDDADADRYRQSGILIPNVRILRLRDAFALAIDVLDFLKAPKLAELDIHFSTDDPVDDLEWQLATPVHAFVERSGCDETLRCFRLRNVEIDTEELLDALNGLPSVTHVTLEGVEAIGRDDDSDTGSIFDQLRAHKTIELL